MKDIAKSLLIEVEYILKFFGQEFGSKTTIKKDPKSGEISLTSINGKISEEDILNMIDKFINMYILCNKCEAPEVAIIVEDEEIYGTCAACGATKTIDPTHKLTAHMKKNPPKDQRDIK